MASEPKPELSPLPPTPPRSIGSLKGLPVPSGAAPAKPAAAPAKPPPPPADTPEEAFKKLKVYNQLILDRHKQIVDLFEDKSISPVKNPDFVKFINDHLAEVNMRYVVFGVFSISGEETEPADREEQLRQQGFEVSGKQLEGLDPHMAQSPIVLAALAAGVNLTSDDDEEASPPPPSAKK